MKPFMIVGGGLAGTHSAPPKRCCKRLVPSEQSHNCVRVQEVALTTHRGGFFVPGRHPLPLKLSDKVREVIFRSVRWRGGAEYQDEVDRPSREVYRQVPAPAARRPHVVLWC